MLQKGSFLQQTLSILTTKSYSPLYFTVLTRVWGKLSAIERKTISFLDRILKNIKTEDIRNTRQTLDWVLPVWEPCYLCTHQVTIQRRTHESWVPQHSPTPVQLRKLRRCGSLNQRRALPDGAAPAPRIGYKPRINGYKPRVNLIVQRYKPRVNGMLLRRLLVTNSVPFLRLQCSYQME